MRLLAIAVGLFVLAACASDRGAGGAADPQARFEGRWIKRGPYTPVHSGSDQIYCIEQRDGRWTITSVSIHHPRLTRKDTPLSRSEIETVPLTWRDGALRFESFSVRGRREHITADVRNEELVLPAILARDDRTWLYHGWMTEAVFTCEHDPRVVPEGSATHSFERWRGQPSFYRTEEIDSVWSRGSKVPDVQFFQRNPAGELVLCAHLVLETDTEGPYVKTPHDSNALVSDHFERLPDEEWDRIRALPVAR